MLVLSRKLNEKIQIGDDVSITVVAIKGNKVRIGIEAPRQVRVVRAELPPKPQGRQVPAAAAADPQPATAELAFIPMRQNTLEARRPGQASSGAADKSSQQIVRSRLTEMRQDAQRRGTASLVASPPAPLASGSALLT